MKPPKKQCCRSTPRCRRCPVLLKAQTRARERAEGRVALVEEIFQGRPRPFPAAVDAALLGLSAARGSA